jgi:hypothetical protein
MTWLWSREKYGCFERHEFCTRERKGTKEANHE